MSQPTEFTEQDRATLERLAEFADALQPIVDKAPDILAKIDEIMPTLEPMLTKLQKNPIFKMLG
jgi:hypothetical protein